MPIISLTTRFSASITPRAILASTAVVTPDGGPKFIVRDGETGFVTSDDHFAEAVAELVRDRGRLAAMRLKALEYALGCSWDAVFDRVYAGYEMAWG